MIDIVKLKICSLDGVIEVWLVPMVWAPCTLLTTASVLPQKRLYISIVLILPLHIPVIMPGCMVKFKQNQLIFKQLQIYLVTGIQFSSSYEFIRKFINLLQIGNQSIILLYTLYAVIYACMERKIHYIYNINAPCN